MIQIGATHRIQDKINTITPGRGNKLLKKVLFFVIDGQLSSQRTAFV